MDQWTNSEAELLSRYLTNLDRSVFALRDLPEVVKGALFSRYSRSEGSLRQVLLREFLMPRRNLPIRQQAGRFDSPVSAESAEKFYDRVLVGFGDDSVAELAGAHLAAEDISLLAAKALEDCRIGLSPLEKSTRYVRFDIRDSDGLFHFYRGPELDHKVYTSAAESLFCAYNELLPQVTREIRARHGREEGESERAWFSATKARALDLLRGLLPAGTLTNVGLFGNGRAYEHLIIKLLSNPLTELQRLAHDIHRELNQVIPVFVRRSMDASGLASARRMALARERLAIAAPSVPVSAQDPVVRLIEFDNEAETKVVAACLFPYSNVPLAELRSAGNDPRSILDAAMADRENRRDRAPRALEQVFYTFEIVANFGVYRDLQRHRMLSQERQALGTALGFDTPYYLDELDLGSAFRRAIDRATGAHEQLLAEVGPLLAQYVVPLAFHIRWYVKANLRELFHLCELRTTPQGHPDYRHIAQEMFRAVQRVHPLLASYAKFVSMEPSGHVLERRASERRIDEKLAVVEPRIEAEPS